MLSHHTSSTSTPSSLFNHHHLHEDSLGYVQHNKIEDVMQEREGQVRNEDNWFDDEGEGFMREYMDLPSPSPVRRKNLRLRRAARDLHLERTPPPPKTRQGNQKSSGIKKTQWNDDDLKQAIDALDSEYTIGEVSQAFNIPRTSLRDHYKKR